MWLVRNLSRWNWAHSHLDQSITSHTRVVVSRRFLRCQRVQKWDLRPHFSNHSTKHLWVRRCNGTRVTQPGVPVRLTEYCSGSVFAELILFYPYANSWYEDSTTLQRLSPRSRPFPPRRRRTTSSQWKPFSNVKETLAYTPMRVALVDKTEDHSTDLSSSGSSSSTMKFKVE